MQSLIAKIQHLLKFPPRIIIQKVISVVYDRINRRWHKKHLEQNDLRTISGPPLNFGLFKHSWFSAESLDPETMAFYVKMYSYHRFDILGSGWIRNSYSAISPGVEGHHYERNVNLSKFDAEGNWLKSVVLPAHLDFGRTCWLKIRTIHPEYIPIDWQSDIKSGFRWDAKVWFREQRKLSDGRPGIDIKVPWELSRLQHLPRIMMAVQHNGQEAKSVFEEVLCQIMDFIMSNPIGMGANFNCPMDIGIRNANILIAYDLLKQLDMQGITDQQTDQWVASYIHQSTLHILDDIEYREGKTSNHYLGNVLGILYAGLYAHSTDETNRLLLFGLQELRRSMLRQFFEDGGNFEGSTAYHRLSGEMMVYGAAAALMLDPDLQEALMKCDIEPWKCKSPLLAPDLTWLNDGDDPFWTRLHDLAKFSIEIAKPSGDVVQFGDNDSGRFVHFSWFGNWMSKEAYTARYVQIDGNTLPKQSDQLFDENTLNQGSFVSAIAGLFHPQIAVPPAMLCSLEYELFRRIGEGKNVPSKTLRKDSNSKIFPQFSDFETWPFHQTKTFEFPGQHSLKERLQSSLFPDFQLGILKSDRIYIALAGISNPNQHHSLSHVHNDKGAVELWVDGKDVLLDPGTYLYTPIPERRQEFRSVLAHNTIVVNGQEQNKPLPGIMGLFNMVQQSKMVAVEANSTELKIELHIGPYKHVRLVKVLEQEVQIHDWCTHEFVQQLNPLPHYSNGYGKLIKR